MNAQAQCTFEELLQQRRDDKAAVAVERELKGTRGTAVRLFTNLMPGARRLRRSLFELEETGLKVLVMGSTPKPQHGRELGLSYTVKNYVGEYDVLVGFVLGDENAVYADTCFVVPAYDINTDSIGPSLDIEGCKWRTFMYVNHVLPELLQHAAEAKAQRSAHVNVAIPRELHGKVERLAKQYGFTPEDVITGAITDAINLIGFETEESNEGHTHE